ncbi:MAG: hypothetical protein J6N76_03030 [Lachnospiraceae bacterium]|nr:hypothetical protein [Lachnospiraceae bacterium]
MNFPITTARNNAPYIPSRTGTNNNNPGIAPTSAEASHKAGDSLRSRLRSLDSAAYKTDSKGRTVYSAESAGKVNGFLQTAGAKTSPHEETLKKKLQYNYKDVSSQIQRAKTAVSAGQAVLKAKRQVMDLKRKLSSPKEDREEVMIALSHAKAMERVAKKKKNHLELEELISTTQKRDERLSEQKSSSSMSYDLLDMAEEKISDALSEIDEAQLENAKEAIAAGGEASGSPLPEEFISDSPMPDELMSEALMSEELMPEDILSEELLSGDLLPEELLSEFAGEEQEMLEDALDQLGAIEVVDPHMSPEELKELKQKHRNKERKDIVKADMAYLKETMKKLSSESHETQTAPMMQPAAFSAAIPQLQIPAELQSSAAFDISV